jgi:hypothetical protein
MSCGIKRTCTNVDWLVFKIDAMATNELWGSGCS